MSSRLLTPPSRPRTRPLGRGDLRLLLLALLGQAPRHGYELIQLVSEMFSRVYTPSAGSVYPLLADFEKQRWVTAEEQGGRKRYRITSLGQAQLKLRGSDVEDAQLRARYSARAISKANLPLPVRTAMQRFTHALMERHGRWQDVDAEHVAQLLEQVADLLALDKRDA
ncbi:PadR family transcriptional regulator [Stenotrophomonas mori]|uniref:PadR family transcriptional regulator n=1 Tax=Stenotrophomonas mori TaxID=2871096 RepID=A0ABT0SHV7_9GAMM|nr:PadR family transcriptional regulator [Stenotrophomonas mori]MCL7714927.1 PadR family transcriptional regulator [Stenotrophomonas mori]